MKIVIIGAGNVGTNLHHALELKGIHAQLVHARPLTANPSPLTDLPEAELYIYTVADHALKDVAERVYAPKALHLHTSGTLPVDVFGADKPHAGVLYFFQSFSKNALIDDWSNIPCLFEGRNIDDVAAIYSFAQTLTGRIYESTLQDRQRLHVAGVFANNFTNLMYRMAAQVIHGTQIPFEVLLPLIDQTAAKVHSLAPKDAQTGPATRADGEVVMKHIELLEKMQDGEFLASDLQFTYMNMSQIIQTASLPQDEQYSVMEILNRALEESNEIEDNYPAPSRRRRKRR